MINAFFFIGSIIYTWGKGVAQIFFRQGCAILALNIVTINSEAFKQRDTRKSGALKQAGDDEENAKCSNWHQKIWRKLKMISINPKLALKRYPKNDTSTFTNIFRLSWRDHINCST